MLSKIMLAAVAALFAFAAEAQTGGEGLLSKPLSVIWKFETQEAANLTPALGPESVYLPLLNGEVVALRASDGQLNWRAEIGGNISAAPGADEKGVYVASENLGVRESRSPFATGSIRSLGLHGGVTLWMRAIPSPIRGKLVSNQQLVFGGAEDGRLYALKKETGEIAWIRQNSAPFKSQPVLADGWLYIGDEAGSLIAVEQATGRILWRYQTRSPLRPSAGVSGGIVFAGSFDGYVHALERASGRLLWRARTGGAVQSVVPAGRCLVVTSLDNFAYCLSPRKGYRIWKRQLPGRVAAQPLVTPSGILFAPLSGEECVVLSPWDGKKLNSINVGEDNNTAAAPILSGGVLIVTTRQGLLAYSDGVRATSSK